MRGGDPCSWQACVVWLWGPRCGSSAYFLLCVLRGGARLCPVQSAGIVTAVKPIAGVSSGQTGQFLEVCCMKLAEPAPATVISL